MAMSKTAENDLMTRVCGDPPLGRMLRTHYWLPAVVGAKLEADGAPARIRLLGDDYVGFRATDGRVGFFDEACPHRGVSLSLARNEDNALRCVFHGWKFRVDGSCVEVPTQPINHDRFCSQVKVGHYPVREAAGVVWVYLGAGEPPPFPRFNWLELRPPDEIFAVQSSGKYNWLQAVETTMDSAHLGVLHQSSVAGLGDIAVTHLNNAPTFEVEQKPYGFRYASVRALDDGRSYVRVNTFVAPWYSIISPNRNNDPAGTIQFTVPADDEHSTFFFLQFRRDGRSARNEPMMKDCKDPTNWPPAIPDDPEHAWGQDREAMKRGHFTGFTAHLFCEDIAMVSSMKPIVDRTKEKLNAADAAVIQVRKAVLNAVKAFLEGEVPASARQEEIDYAEIVAQCDYVPAGTTWRDHFAPTSATPV
jgi:phenylpropionate dioxygenase-like ring-hydroxylating dioxygenase large terminal subunit